MLKHFTNGNVYVDAHSEPVAELWTYGERVIESFEAAELVGSGSEVETINLDGGWVVPAFRDGHCHPLFAARESRGVHLTGLTSVEAIQAELSAYRQMNPNCEWIDAAVYDRGLTAGREGEAAALLDAAVAEVPVVLHADDHHTLWVNTAALKAAGLGSAAAVAEAQSRIHHGSIDVDAEGNATGILREWEAMSIVLDRAPQPSMAEDLVALDEAQSLLVANGVVAVQEAWIDRGMAEVYIEAAKLGRLKLRVDLAFRFAPGEWRESLAYFEEMRSQVERLNHPLLSARTAKFFSDGVFGSSTAHVHEPYEPASPAAGTHGQPVWPKDEFLEATQAAAERGFVLHIHAIGDAGVTDALDAIEAAGSPAGCTIAHTELVRDGEFARFASLGVTANFEPFWAQNNSMLTSCVPQLGRHRIDRMYRMRDAINSGVNISFGSDWPVSSFVPLEGIQVGVTRAPIGSSEPSWVAEQAVTVREAFEAYSAGVARQLLDDEAGDLKAGQRADFIVLAKDPFSTPERELAAIEVMATYSSAELLFSR
jgi:predicted amidohydrolase YtcJ